MFHFLGDQQCSHFVRLKMWKQTFTLKQLLICVDADEEGKVVDVAKDNVDEDNDDEQPRRVIPVTPGSGHFA